MEIFKIKNKERNILKEFIDPTFDYKELGKLKKSLDDIIISKTPFIYQIPEQYKTIQVKLLSDLNEMNKIESDIGYEDKLSDCWDWSASALVNKREFYNKLIKLWKNSSMSKTDMSNLLILFKESIKDFNVSTNFNVILNNSEINGYFNYYYDTNTSLLTDKENKNKKGVINFKYIPLYEQIKKVLIIYISLINIFR